VFFYEFLSAFICSEFAYRSPWTSETIDEILTEGDRLYLDCLDSRGDIPDTETLSLNYLLIVVNI